MQRLQRPTIFPAKKDVSVAGLPLECSLLHHDCQDSIAAYEQRRPLELATAPTLQATSNRTVMEFVAHHAYAAQLRYHGEHGVEAQILRDGDVLVGYRFQTRALAVQ